VCVYSAKDVT